MNGETILLVDDSRFFLELEKGFLRQTTAKILTAPDGPTALELAEKHQPSLIYLELNLPGMDGAECCRRLKDDRRLKRIPVIMVHDRDARGNLQIYRACGCDAVLKKPLDRKEFLDTGHRFLSVVERRQKRVSWRQMVVVRQGENCFCGSSIDLSEGGMFVSLEEKLREQQLVHLSFVLPNSKSNLVEVSGRIAWTNQGALRMKPGLPKGVGIEFVGMSPEKAAIISDFVDKRISVYGRMVD